MSLVLEPQISVAAATDCPSSRLGYMGPGDSYQRLGAGRGRPAGLDSGCGTGRHRWHGAHLRHVVGLLPRAVWGDPPATPRSSAGLGRYVQMLIVPSIVATGAGLRVAADFIEGRATITAVAAVLAVAVPVGVFLGLMYALSHYLVRRRGFSSPTQNRGPGPARPTRSAGFAK